MKIGIISGSHRVNSESERVGIYIKSNLEKLVVDSYFLSLANNPLPLWDDGMWSGETELIKTFSLFSNIKRIKTV